MGRLMAHFYDRMMARSEAACLSAWRNDLLESTAGCSRSAPGPVSIYRSIRQRSEHWSCPNPILTCDRKLESRIARRYMRPSVAVSDGSLESLAFPDGEFDYVTCMLVLCSVPISARRSTKSAGSSIPGGRFVFMEHVAAKDRPDAQVATTTRTAVETISGGCHLTRRTEEAIIDGGFRSRPSTEIPCGLRSP